MVTIINPDNLNSIVSGLSEMTIMVPMLSSSDIHYTQSTVSSLYIYDIQDNREYLVGFRSVDMINVDPDIFFTTYPGGVCVCYKKKYVRSYGLKCIDGDMLVWYYNNRPITIDQELTRIFSIFRRRGKYPQDHLNDIIPIMRMLDYFRSVKDQILELGIPHYNSLDKGFEFYDQVYLDNTYNIERVGIAIDQDRYRELHEADVGAILYTEFNPYTLTGRPGSSHRGINFSAMNKSDGSREVIISRTSGGKLIEFDYDSYHPRIIADMVGYKLPPGNVHKNLAVEYFGTTDISDADYEESKKITFRQLYGGVEDKYRHIKFFTEIDRYKSSAWDRYVLTGSFTSPLTGRVFKREWFPDMSESKMFNYLIQAFETEMNMMVLGEIIQYLYQTPSRIILYTYDSIVIDFHPSSGIEDMRMTRDLMMRFNYPVHIKVGMNYGDMIDVDID